MGKILQIQVRAYTYNEDEVLEAYPETCALVWPEYFEKKIQTQYIKHGILELATDLESELKFADWPKELKENITEYVFKINQVKFELEENIANWQASQANKLSYTLEDLFLTLEKEIKEYYKKHKK